MLNFYTKILKKMYRAALCMLLFKQKHFLTISQIKRLFFLYNAEKKNLKLSGTYIYVWSVVELFFNPFIAIPLNVLGPTHAQRSVH